MSGIKKCNCIGSRTVLGIGDERSGVLSGGKKEGSNALNPKDSPILEFGPWDFSRMDGRTCGNLTRHYGEVSCGARNPKPSTALRCEH